jgi:predicted DsbA family dithiol-disulfide isomerase
MKRLTVEIWADFVCPWCYLGKKRLNSALADFGHGSETDVVWRSFQLDPDAPAGTELTVSGILAKKYGVDLGQAEAMNARVSALAAQEGLEYRLDRARYANTFDAHRLNHLAASHRFQSEMGERLFRFYFTEGGSLSDTDALVALAAEIGIPEAEAREVLLGSRYAEEVRADILKAERLDIHGVPFMLVDGKYALSGAQSTAAFLATLEQAWSAS